MRGAHLDVSKPEPLVYRSPWQHQPGSTGLVHGVSGARSAFTSHIKDVALTWRLGVRLTGATEHHITYVHIPSNHATTSALATQLLAAAGYGGHLLAVTAHLLDLDGATFTEDCDDGGGDGVTSMNLQAQSQLLQPSNNS